MSHQTTNDIEGNIITNESHPKRMANMLYVFVRLKALPVPRQVLVDWESALYGALMIGWGTTLLLIGRLAFARNDHALKRTLLIGLFLWLAVEAAASVWFGVWLNVGVDAGVFTLFAVPLLRREA